MFVFLLHQKPTITLCKTMQTKMTKADVHTSPEFVPMCRDAADEAVSRLLPSWNDFVECMLVTSADAAAQDKFFMDMHQLAFDAIFAEETHASARVSTATVPNSISAV